MRHWYICFVFLLAGAASSVQGQIPNPGFESWTSGNPDGWFPNNAPPYATPITQFAPGHSGSSAAKGAVVSFLGVSTVGPALQTFFPYTGRPGQLTGSYQFTSVASDSFSVAVLLYKQSLGIPIAAGIYSSGVPHSQYTTFTAPLEYVSAEAPDSAWIWIVIEPGEGDTVHIGSSFVVDDLAFSGTPTSVAEASTRPSTFALAQNYPNPFNPSTLIQYDLPQAAHVRLAVYDMLGQEVRLLVSEDQPAGTHQVRFNAEGLPSGVYLYRINADAFTATRRLVLVR